MEVEYLEPAVRLPQRLFVTSPTPPSSLSRPSNAHGHTNVEPLLLRWTAASVRDVDVSAGALCCPPTPTGSAPNPGACYLSAAEVTGVCVCVCVCFSVGEMDSAIFPLTSRKNGILSISARLMASY